MYFPESRFPEWLMYAHDDGDGIHWILVDMCRTAKSKCGNENIIARVPKGLNVVAQKSKSNQHQKLCYRTV
jgi:hypothetical protein